MFYAPPELLSENSSNKDYAKVLTNEDVYNIMYTLTERLNDIHYILLTINGFKLEDKPSLLPLTRLNAGNIIRYLDLVNSLCEAMQQKVKSIQDNLNETVKNNETYII